MASVDALVQTAVAAIKNGRRDEARQLLEQALAQDEYHEQAWLWLSGCVDTLEEQMTCLDNVLTINPANAKALRGREALAKRMAAAQRPPSSAMPSGTTPTPFTVDPFAGSPFSDAPASRSQPPANSSVEWGNDAGGVPAHGSGKNVQLPTDAEYDAWLANLPLGSNPDESGATPFTGAPQETAYDVGPARGAAAPPNPFDTYDPASSLDSYSYGSPQSGPASGDRYDSGFGGGPFAATTDFGEASADQGTDYGAYNAYDNDYSNQYGGAPSYDQGFDNNAGSGYGQPMQMAGGAIDVGADASFGMDDDLQGYANTQGGSDTFSNVSIGGSSGFSFKNPSPGTQSGVPDTVTAAPARAASSMNVFGVAGGAVLGSAASPAVMQLFQAIPIEIRKGGPAGASELRPLLILGALNVVSLILLLINLSS